MNLAVHLVLPLLCLSMGFAGYRLLKGPKAPDRVAALDACATNAVAMFLVLSIRLESDLFFDAILVVALLGFVGTVALARSLDRGDLFD